MQQICARWKRYMWSFVHVAYDHVGEAQRGDSVLCDDGCPSNNLPLHSNERICMTRVCRFSVLSYVCQLCWYFPCSVSGLNNLKDLRKWMWCEVKAKGLLGLFLFINHCMKCWKAYRGVLVDLDWMSVLVVWVCVHTLCACILGLYVYEHFLTQSQFLNFPYLFKLHKLLQTCIYFYYSWH